MSNCFVESKVKLQCYWQVKCRQYSARTNCWIWSYYFSNEIITSLWRIQLLQTHWDCVSSGFQIHLHCTSNLKIIHACLHDDVKSEPLSPGTNLIRSGFINVNNNQAWYCVLWRKLCAKSHTIVEWPSERYMWVN